MPFFFFKFFAKWMTERERESGRGRRSFLFCNFCVYIFSKRVRSWAVAVHATRDVWPSSGSWWSHSGRASTGRLRTANEWTYNEIAQRSVQCPISFKYIPVYIIYKYRLYDCMYKMLPYMILFCSFFFSFAVSDFFFFFSKPEDLLEGRRGKRQKKKKLRWNGREERDGYLCWFFCFWNETTKIIIIMFSP